MNWLYKLLRISNDVKAISKSIDKGTPKPLLKRLVNKWIGRNIASKLWWK